METWYEEFEDINEVAKPAKRDREIVPEGEHRFTITKASSDDQTFDVWLAHEDDALRWVFCKFYKENPKQRWLIGSLARALGYTAATWPSVDVPGLKDRTVRARIWHRSDNDRTFVNVGEFFVDLSPAVTEAAPAHTKARTADQKFRAERRDVPGAADDIPF